VLITLGGADADNQTLKVIQAVKQIDIAGFEAVVVVGANNPHRPQLQVESRDSTVPIAIVTNATNMDELMAWADLAVSGGGSTCWELAFMGLPALVLILADNQRAVAEGLDEAGIVVNLGWHNNLNATDITQAVLSLAGETDARTEMSQRGRQLIDGRGNDRVVSKLLARCSN
jgi:spore coat polysaccharide biosynthesis predicted glycosyltransferase SpsG